MAQKGSNISSPNYFAYTHSWVFWYLLFFHKSHCFKELKKEENDLIQAGENTFFPTTVSNY